MLVAFNAPPHLLCEPIARNEYEKHSNPLPMVESMNGWLNQCNHYFAANEFLSLFTLFYCFPEQNKTNEKGTRRLTYSCGVSVCVYRFPLPSGAVTVCVCVLSQMQILLSHTSHDSPKLRTTSIERKKKHQTLNFFSFVKMHGIPYSNTYM